MRILLPIVLFLLLMAGAFAALDDEQYIVVVGASAPASDVVIAANFVASMKATLGVTFASALDTDVDLDDYRGKTIVVIDGRNRAVRIFGTSNAAAAANTYFSRQGFDVESSSEAEDDDIEVKKEDIPPPSKPVVPPARIEMPIVEINETFPAAVVNTSLNVTVEEIPEALPEARVPMKKQGVLKRVWIWFSGWF